MFLTIPGSGRTAGEQRLIHLFFQYSYLQTLDFLTTMAFLVNGIEEANPVVNLFLKASPSPVLGLLAVKVIAVVLGLACWRLGKARLLGRVNLLFASLVAWNLLALISGSASGNGSLEVARSIWLF